MLRNKEQERFLHFKQRTLLRQDAITLDSQNDPERALKMTTRRTLIEIWRYILAILLYPTETYIMYCLLSISISCTNGNG